MAATKTNVINKIFPDKWITVRPGVHISENKKYMLFEIGKGTPAPKVKQKIRKPAPRKSAVKKTKTAAKSRKK